MDMLVNRGVLPLEKQITKSENVDTSIEEGEWQAIDEDELKRNLDNATPSKKIIHDLTMSPLKEVPPDDPHSDEKAENLLRAVINLTDEDENQGSSPWTPRASSAEVSPYLPEKPVGWFEETNLDEIKMQAAPSVSPASPASPLPLPPYYSTQAARQPLHKRVRQVEYKTARTPEERALLFAVVAAVKKILRKKSLSKEVFKFICKHASGNVFTRLSDKKRISRPEKLVESRLTKIKQLVDAECKKVARVR